MKKLLLLIVLILGIFPIIAQENNEKPPEVGIVEHLGAQVPMDLEFTDSEGKKMKLKDIIDKPTILSLVYYHCPGICSPLLTGMADVMDKVDLEPGKNFEALTISFDFKETYDKAANWKSNYLSSFKRKVDPSFWNFMVGDSANVMKIANAVGFHFKPDGEKDFVHAATLVVLTPDGKISRYLLGTEYLPFDVKMSLAEASEGKSMPTITKMIQFCFSYDRENKKYVFNFTKVAGSLIFLSAGIFFAVLVVKGRKRRKNKTQDENKGGENDESIS